MLLYIESSRLRNDTRCTPISKCSGNPATTVPKKDEVSIFLLCFDVSESVDPEQTALLDQSGLDLHCQNQQYRCTFALF